MAQRGVLSWIVGWMLLAGTLPLAAQTGYAVRSDGTDAQDDFLYSIDLRTGIATPIGYTGYEDVESLSFDRGCDDLFAVDDTTDRLLLCDVLTGACTLVGSLGVDVTDTGLAFVDDITLYLSTDAPKDPFHFYQVSRFTGTATRVGDQGQEVTALAAGPAGLFGLGGDGTNNLVRIDPSTGAATAVGPLGTIGFSDAGLDFAADGVLWGLADGGTRNPSRTFTVDPATGAATVVATVRLENGTELSGFESLALPDGACTTLIGPDTVLEVPTASEWGLALLAALLTAAAMLQLRRRRA